MWIDAPDKLGIDDNVRCVACPRNGTLAETLIGSQVVWSLKYSAIVIDHEGHFSYQKPVEIPMMWKILHISCSMFTDELR